MLRSQQYETRNASLDEIGERYDRCIMLAPYTHFPRNVRLSHLIWRRQAPAPLAYDLKILQVTQGRSRSFEIIPVSEV